MTREEKEVIVKELSDKMASTSFFYIMDASTMTVAQINRFRRACFEKGMDYKVYKNTLIRKALDTLPSDTAELDAALKGTSGILFSNESGSAPARMVQEFHKANPPAVKADPMRPIFKGAYIDSDLFVGAEHLETLSKIKSKQELIGEVIGLLQSPAKNVISALQSGGNILAGVLKTLSEKSE
jgi:large subunit ribosomal protein L10